MKFFMKTEARPVEVKTTDGNVNVQSINRVQVYKGSYTWNHKWFTMDGFYRTGHYHWGYEGDFFGLYPEANYGPVMDHL
jgi:hypothetical protein